MIDVYEIKNSTKRMEKDFFPFSCRTRIWHHQIKVTGSGQAKECTGTSSLISKGWNSLPQDMVVVIDGGGQAYQWI